MVGYFEKKKISSITKCNQYSMYIRLATVQDVYIHGDESKQTNRIEIHFYLYIIYTTLSLFSLIFQELFQILLN